MSLFDRIIIALGGTPPHMQPDLIAEGDERARRNAERIAQRKAAMGTRYLAHPDNRVKIKRKPESMLGSGRLFLR